MTCRNLTRDVMGTDHHDNTLDYNHIADGIYIGTNVCCQSHFDERLLAVGIAADISLEQEQLDAPYGVELFLWLPTQDHAPPSMSQLHAGVCVVQQLVKDNKKVYVHCKNGHGRAPTLVAAYFIAEGLNVDDAVAGIKTMRPSIHLETSQLTLLRQFAHTFQ